MIKTYPVNPLTIVRMSPRSDTGLVGVAKVCMLRIRDFGLGTAYRGLVQFSSFQGTNSFK